MSGKSVLALVAYVRDLVKLYILPSQELASFAVFNISISLVRPTGHIVTRLYLHTNQFSFFVDVRSILVLLSKVLLCLDCTAPSSVYSNVYLDGENGNGK